MADTEEHRNEGCSGLESTLRVSSSRPHQTITRKMLLPPSDRGLRLRIEAA